MSLVINPATGTLVYTTADFHKPWTIGITPDPAIQAEIDALNAQLQPILGTVIGQSSKAISRADQCGAANGRTCESLVGDVVTDAMRDRYAPIGVQFAITNSGGPARCADLPGGRWRRGFCPAAAQPPYLITRGQVLSVLPFGNVVSPRSTVTGAELKAFLENGVSLAPTNQGRFPQVSGLCFTYNVAAAAGSRVTGAVVANADGTCSATAVDLTAGSSYKIAINDFMACWWRWLSGGHLRSPGMPPRTSWTRSSRTTSPPRARSARSSWERRNGRINCADSNGGTAPNCLIVTPSP